MSPLLKRAKALRFFGSLLVFSGLVPVAWFVSRMLIPAARALPEFDAIALPARFAWLPNPTGMLIALAGLVVMWFGASLIARQLAILEAERRDAEDRLRRVHQYAGEGRIEPYIGPQFPRTEDFDPH
jgi:hypothetical protein